MFFNDWLNRRSCYSPDVVAVVDDANGDEYTYRLLDMRAANLAAHLQTNWAVQPGDRVACLAGNRIEYIDLYFACGKIGAVLTPLNYRLPAAALAELIEDCRPALLIYESQFREAVEELGRQAVRLRCWSIDADVDSAPTVGTVAARGEPVGEVRVHESEEHETAMILYTSGTTGRAKGAMITWRQIHWNVLNTTIGLQLSQHDAAFLNMPLYHTGGWHVLFTPLMLMGGRVVLQPRFDAARCNERVFPAGVTILFGVPTMLRMMAEAPNFAESDFSHVRFAICGGEPCPLPIIETYRQRGVPIRQGYGLTEAGPNCFSLPAEDAIRKQGSIGFPNFHIATRLVRADGAEAEVDQVGELWMKGPHVFAGYWGHPAATKETVQDGWLRTGDLMRRDAEGYHFVVGRLKDMYVSGGENVYPAQVERVLQNHPAVALAAVVGATDPKWGETGWAFMQLHEGATLDEAELIAWARNHLAKYQCPTRVVFLSELPLGHSGKVDKLALRALASQPSDPT